MPILLGHRFPSRHLHADACPTHALFTSLGENAGSSDKRFGRYRRHGL